MKTHTLLVTYLILLLTCVNVQYTHANQVKSYYGIYDASQKEIGLPARSLQGPFIEPWQDAEKASKPYKIAILVPQLSDTWMAFSYGALTQAKKLGLQAELSSTKNYLNFGNQRQQLESHINKDINGIIFSSISYQNMNKPVEMVTQTGVPVVAMGNDILAPSNSGKSLVSFFEMGYLIGQHLIKLEGNKPVNVAFFPWPQRRWLVC